MRLRALHLGNVRKFAGQRASITGIGDGITVVSEANEFGKSTFFDALHALFFEKYSSANKPVKSLQPYAKGAVEVAAEVETDAGLFRVEKSFVQRKSARILRLPAGTLIAQDDEAERWIQDMLGSDKNGPAGLLWVRQGVMGLDADSKDETLKQLETRRDLLSSVSGEIDAMTGGRRMDRVMKRVADDLKGLVTTTSKPTGPWRALIADIAEMEEDLAARNAQIDKLSTALGDRRRAETALAHLDVADAVTARTAALGAAEEAFATAKAHASRVALAAQSHRLAELAAQTARAELDQFLAAVDALETAQATAAKTRQAWTVAQGATVARMEEVKAARTTKDDAKRALKQARAAFDLARTQEAVKTAKARSNDLKVLLQQIETVQKTRDEARAIVQSSKATPQWLQQLEQAQTDVTAQTAAVQAQAVALRMNYTGDIRVIHDGASLPGDHPIVLPGTTQLELPGIGTLSIEVPATGAAALAKLADCEALRDALLVQIGADSMEAGRDMAAKRAKAMQDGVAADTVVKTLAPNGTDPLLSELAAADLLVSEFAEASTNNPPLPDRLALERALAEAERSDADAQTDLTAKDAAATLAREAEIRAKAAADTADQALATAAKTAGPPDSHEVRRRDLVRADATAVEALETEAQALETLRAAAPDMATAQAELTRAKDAVQAATAQIQTLRERIAALSAEIHASSDAGVEEMRDTLSDQLDTTRAQAARLAGKAAALIRLQRALEAERLAARDTYFGPVQEELKPLLAILYDEAGLQFDTDSLLPAGLTRSDAEEQLDRLSGGTQEQIAILTRLAFARLFKGQGRHMPIVLDDALVYSDDGRIVKMFTALTRVAQDQQILVFTCRTMAFLELGGTRPVVTVDDL